MVPITNITGSKNCLLCNAEFIPRAYQLKIGHGKYCSRDCSNKSTAKRGSDSFHWKGDGIGYDMIHDWLRNTYGRASRCENVGCPGHCNKYQWAKLKNKEYERKRENFIELCLSCHVYYDRKPDTTIKISKSLKSYYDRNR